MKKIRIRSLALGLLTAFGLGVGAFEVDPASGQQTGENTWTYQITAPEAGTYILVTYCSRPEASSTPARVTAKWDDGPNRVRTIIQANQTSGRAETVRVIINSTTETHTLVMTSAESTMTNLDFVYVKPVAPPPEADAFVPPTTPPVQRPTVLINPTILPTIKANLTVGANLAVWTDAQTVATTPYPFDPPADEELAYDGELLNAVRLKAFYYLMQSDATVGNEAVSIMRRYMNQVDFGASSDVSRDIGESIWTMGIVYDWCNSLISAEDKAFFRERFYYFAATMEIGWPPFREPAVYGHANEAQLGRDLLGMAIAMYPDDSLAYKYVSYGLIAVSAPSKTYMYQSGKHDQGTSYGNYRFGWGDLHSYWQFNRMSGYEVFDRALTAHLPYRWIYQRMPNNRLFTEGDDFFVTDTGPYPGNSQLYLICAGLFADPLFKSEYGRINDRVDTDPLYFLLLNDPNLTAVDNRASLPQTAYYPEPLGSLVARTGWNFGDTSDDVVVSLIGAGYQYCNHQHLDAGSFQIYYRGFLMGDIGQYNGYGSTYAWNFNRSTVAHSAMLIRDPDQQSSPMGANFAANSGTQEIQRAWIPPASLDEQLADDSFRSGRMLAYGFGPDQNTPDYSFFQADLTASFSTKVSSYVRNFIFLKLGLADTPAALIVYDNLAVLADRMQPMLQLNSPFTPTADGNALVFLNSATSGRTSRVFAETLLPANRVVSTATGSDVYVIDGTAYPPTFTPSATLSRTQITAPEGGDKSTYLHVLQIQNGDATALPVAWNQDDNGFQVQLADRLVSFSRNGAVRTAAFPITVANDNTRALILDLTAGSWTVNGQTFTAGSDSRGVYVTLNAGTYQVVPAQ